MIKIAENTLIRNFVAFGNDGLDLFLVRADRVTELLNVVIYHTLTAFVIVAPDFNQ